MKLLAVSDIHGNVEAVRDLRAREANAFDAIVVAGDIGGKQAAAILDILASFACPVMYVYGNWDSKLPYDADFGPDCHHLHLRTVACGGWAFAGFSGLPAHWGLNPIAAAVRQEVRGRHRRILDAHDEAKAALVALRARRDRRATSARARLDRIAASKAYAAYVNDRQSASREILRLNREALAPVIAGAAAGAERTVVVTHERLHRTDQDMSGVKLFLFGHRHGFQSLTFRGARFVNVSVLDDWASVRPSDKRRFGDGDLRNVNLGTYTVIELVRGRVDARSVGLTPRLDGWTVLAGERRPGLAWLERDGRRGAPTLRDGDPAHASSG